MNVDAIGLSVSLTVRGEDTAPTFNRRHGLLSVHANNTVMTSTFQYENCLFGRLIRSLQRGDDTAPTFNSRHGLLSVHANNAVIIPSQQYEDCNLGLQIEPLQRGEDTAPTLSSTLFILPKN